MSNEHLLVLSNPELDLPVYAQKGLGLSLSPAGGVMETEGALAIMEASAWTGFAELVVGGSQRGGFLAPEFQAGVRGVQQDALQLWVANLMNKLFGAPTAPGAIMVANQLNFHAERVEKMFDQAQIRALGGVKSVWRLLGKAARQIKAERDRLMKQRALLKLNIADEMAFLKSLTQSRATSHSLQVHDRQQRATQDRLSRWQVGLAQVERSKRTMNEQVAFVIQAKVRLTNYLNWVVGGVVHPRLIPIAPIASPAG